MPDSTADEPLLTVVLPTCDRPHYLQYAVQSLLPIADWAQLVLVSNGTTLESDLGSVNPSDTAPFEVVRTSGRLPMNESWLSGFALARGTWVYFLGDDDMLIMPSEQFRATLREQDVDGIAFSFESFQWEDSEGAVQPNFLTGIKHIRATRRVRRIPGTRWESDPLRDLPSGAGSSVVKRTYLESLQSNGDLFAGISPDWGVAASYLYDRKEFLESSEILVAIGHSRVSSLQDWRTVARARSRGTYLRTSDSRVHPLLSGFDVRQCSTTFASRLDSICRSRESHSLDVTLSEWRLAMEAFRTTPRHIRSMRHFLLTKEDANALLVTCLATYGLIMSLVRRGMQQVHALIRGCFRMSTSGSRD